MTVGGMEVGWGESDSMGDCCSGSASRLGPEGEPARGVSQGGGKERTVVG